MVPHPHDYNMFSHAKPIKMFCRFVLVYEELLLPLLPKPTFLYNVGYHNFFCCYDGRCTHLQFQEWIQREWRCIFMSIILLFCIRMISFCLSVNEFNYDQRYKIYVTNYYMDSINLFEIHVLDAISITILLSVYSTLNQKPLLLFWKYSLETTTKWNIF